MLLTLLTRPSTLAAALRSPSGGADGLLLDDGDESPPDADFPEADFEVDTLSERDGLSAYNYRSFYCYYCYYH